MSGFTMTTTTKLYVMNCCSCGVAFGIPDDMDTQRRDDHRAFYCPNGHSQSYRGENDAEKFKRLLNRERDRSAALTADLDQTVASLRATRGVVTRQRKRLEKVVAGVCPVDGCHRHFRDLRRHISTQHPDYQGGVG